MKSLGTGAELGGGRRGGPYRQLESFWVKLCLKLGFKPGHSALQEPVRSLLCCYVDGVSPTWPVMDMIPLNPFSDGCIVLLSSSLLTCGEAQRGVRSWSLSASSCSYLSLNDPQIWGRKRLGELGSLSRGLGPSLDHLCSPICAEAPTEEPAGVLNGVRSPQNHQTSLFLMPSSKCPTKAFSLPFEWDIKFPFCVEFSPHWIFSISLWGSSASQLHACTGLLCDPEQAH